jgi:hypothetical protein
LHDPQNTNPNQHHFPIPERTVDTIYFGDMASKFTHGSRHLAGRALIAGALMVFWAGYAGAEEPPPVSLTAGGSLHMPQASPGVSAGYGTRIGLAFPFSLHAGDIDIPAEWGITLRTASLVYSDLFDRLVFTDIQLPVIFHGSPAAWKPVELLGVWTPSYTLDMVSTAPDGSRIPGAKDLRTRYNMGFGAGAQVSVHGFRLRGYGAYNIFPPFPGSTSRFSDWMLEVAVPLAGKKASR